MKPIFLVGRLVGPMPLPFGYRVFPSLRSICQVGWNYHYLVSKRGYKVMGSLSLLLAGGISVPA